MTLNPSLNRFLLSLALGCILTVSAWIPLHGAEPWIAPAEANGYKNIKPLNSASIAAGKKVYDKYCTLCHGETGGGDGASAKTMLIPPAAFTDKALMEKQSDGALAWKILNGRGPMPSWAPVLQEDQIWNVINYIRQFTK
ncbi:MAG: cytochrome c [bacterium]